MGFEIDSGSAYQGEGGKDQRGMSVGTATKVNLHTRPHSIDRKVDSDNARSSTCTSSLLESPENKKPSTQTISGFQHNHDFGPGCKRGASLVAEQSEELEWKGSVRVNTTETDTSLLGWGAVSKEVQTGGLWSEGDRMYIYTSK